MNKNKLVGGALAAALALVGLFEGTRYVAYQDSGGVWTICTGATKGVQPGDTATPEECRDRLIVELMEHAKPLERIPHQLPDNVIVAWADFCYNVGVGNCQNSTGYKMLRNGQIYQACQQLLLWRYTRDMTDRRLDCFDDANARTCGGIKKRRITEYQLCVGDISIDEAVRMFN